MPDALIEPRLSQLREAIQAVKLAVQLPPKKRATKIASFVSTICEYAYIHGLGNDELLDIVNLVSTRSGIDQTSATSLVKSLYPASKLPSQVLVTIAGALGHGRHKPSSSTQALLLKWLIMVFEVVESPATFSRMYGLLFNLLDLLSLRAQICHLLALLTRKKHVVPYRVQRLLGLYQSTGGDPAIFALLRVYKDFCPDIVLNSGAGRATNFKHPNPEWRERMQYLKHAGTASFSEKSPAEAGFKVTRRGYKRSKVSAVPELHSLRTSGSTTTLEEIDSVEAFVGNLEKIELPSQMISALDDSLLQKYLTLVASNTGNERLEYWLRSFFENELNLVRQRGNPSAALADLLAKLHDFVRKTKRMPAAAEEFLKYYLQHWHGLSDENLILELLASIRFDNFEDFYAKLLRPAEDALLRHNPHAHDKILQFCTRLLRFHQVLSTEHSTDAEMQKRFNDIVSYSSRVIHYSLTLSSVNVGTSSAVLALYQAILTFSTVHSYPLTLPQPHALYLLLFSNSTSIQSQLCAILASYKTTLAKETSRFTQQNKDLLNQFNEYLTDICNLLWRNRALDDQGPIAKGCLYPRQYVSTLEAYLLTLDRDYSLASSLSLSHQPLLSAFNKTGFEPLEEQAEANGEQHKGRVQGPATQKALAQHERDGGLKVGFKEFQVQNVKALDSYGLGGYKALMEATMKDLMSTAI